MRFLRRLIIRLSNFATGRRADQRVREEMAEHLALQTEENLRAGMSPPEARRQAALKLGAAQLWVHTQQCEIIRRNHLESDAQRLGRSGQVA